MSHLHLNIFPIKVPDVAITVGVLPFVSKDTLRQLRDQHQGTHLFKRDKIEERDVIFSIPLDGTKCSLASEHCEVKLRERLGIAKILLIEAFTAIFAKASNRQIVDVSPLSVLSAENSHDYLRIAADGKSFPTWLSVRLGHKIDARVFAFNGREPFLGLLFDHHAIKQIARPCSDWILDRFDLKGYYVSEKVPFRDTRLQPRLRLAGKVEKIDGTTLSLADCRDGKEVVEASEVQLDANYHGFTAALEFVFGRDWEQVDESLFQILSSAQIGPRKLEELTRIGNRLTQKPLAVLPGIELSVLPALQEGNPLFPPVLKAPQALYIFNKSLNKPPATDAKRGILENGPYSQEFFTPTKPKFCVICEQSKKGIVEQFLLKLFEGNSEPGRNSYFPNGLIKTYRLQGRDVKFFTAENGSAAAYRKAAQDALAIVATEADRWNLAYVQVDGSSRELHGNANPYLAVKSAFLSQQIPVQEFRTETVNQYGVGLDFTLSNLALASYAKLGGTPWQLKVDNPLAHELVIGLGSASISDSRLGARQRMVGVTTLFTNEGRYLLGSMSRAVPFEEFSEAILEMLTTAIERAKTDMNWQRGDEVRLIFHSFKPFRDAEANAVIALAEKLKEFTVDFAFLHVAQEHEIMLFDSRNPGVTGFRRDIVKGEFAPLRGQYILLNKHNSILSLTGAKQVKKPTDGMPYPVLLHLHRNSTFTDLDYLTKQMFVFASHSWRSFDMSKMPVTILYSQLIARLLGRLGSLQSFGPDSISARLNRLRWYL